MERGTRETSREGRNYGSSGGVRSSLPPSPGSTELLECRQVPPSPTPHKKERARRKKERERERGGRYVDFGWQSDRSIGRSSA